MNLVFNLIFLAPEVQNLEGRYEYMRHTHSCLASGTHGAHWRTEAEVDTYLLNPLGTGAGKEIKGVALDTRFAKCKELMTQRRGIDYCLAGDSSNTRCDERYSEVQKTRFGMSL